MAIFLAVVAAVVAFLFSGLQHAFVNNVGLNSVTLGVLLVGIILNFRHATMLEADVRWAEQIRSGRPAEVTSTTGPRLLAPLAAMLGDRRDRFALSPAALRSLLDGVSSRLDETREMARYLTGLMIFLGLLGTFWGLSQTVGSIGEVIRNLTISGDDVQSAFAGLKQGLDAPLSGMGTAFSTSLIVGFLDLRAGQAQNVFYNELEDWLSGQTKLGSNVGSTDSGEQPVPAYIQALLEQTADSLDNLQRVIARGEESRISANTNMRQLTDRLSILADQMKTEQSLMLKLAENQLEMRPLLARLAEGASSSPMDEQTRIHVRNMDATLHRLVEDLAIGRDEMVREIRSEFKLLARTIAALAEDEPPPRRPDA
jgi:hypothetical protein